MTRRAWAVPLAWLASLLIAATAAFWAGLVALRPTTVGSGSESPILYDVTEGSVSRVLRFNAEASWTLAATVRSQAVGVVTAVQVVPGSEISAGSVLFSRGLRPTFAAQGAIPSFRDLAPGLRGADVKQLQGFLAVGGYYRGSQSGYLDSATETAVRAWQRAIQVPATGTVPSGDLVFFPALPVHVVPTDALQVGQRLAGGEAVLKTLPSAPTFTITLGADQVSLVPLSAAVRVHHDAGVWQGSIASSSILSTGELVLQLGGINDQPLCGNQCATVPFGDTAIFSADIIAVPEITGPLVPIAALRTKATGAIVVVGADGHEIPVQLLASAEGRAIVSGINPGMTIQLFGSDATSQAPAASPAPS
jgi:hypothetical protein